MTAGNAAASYWDRVAVSYQRHTRIATNDFHYGPLLPGERTLQLLPPRVATGRCLEAGAGAGQNSIFLARQGARCVALDASSRQIEQGRRLARRCRVTIDYRQQTLESLPDPCLGQFDLVHSVHALEFVDDAPAVIHAMARMLKPGGILLLATLHPLAAAEPVRVARGQMAALLTDYFNPAADTRGGCGGWPTISARMMPFGKLIEAIGAAGCRIERVLEPRPPPLPEMSAGAIRREVPYESRAWRARYQLLAVIPFTLIVRAVRL